jgi:hypothetical protein
MRKWLVTAGLCLLSSPVLAVGANPTRPTFSDNAQPMATGYLELELGGQYWHDEQWATPFLLKIGLSDMAEFKLGGEGLRYEGHGDRFGFGNLGLFGKFRFLDQQGMSPAMAVLGAVMLPTAADEVGGGTTNLSALLLMSGRFGPMGWDLNLGLDINNLDGGVYYDLPAILALSATIAGPIGVIMEVADYIPLSDQVNALHLLGAVTWTVTPRVVLDAAFVKGFDGAPDYQVLFGLTATLARLW